MIIIGQNRIVSADATGISGSGTGMSVSTIVRLSVGDYLEAVVYQNSGGALNIDTYAEWSPVFFAYWVRN
jgi:hypothetical protein